MLLLFPLIIGLSMVGSYLPSRRAAKIAIVEVLRHE
jgi:ABC-type lipoprotein release transport system permease subunit